MLPNFELQLSHVDSRISISFSLEIMLKSNKNFLICMSFVVKCRLQFIFLSAIIFFVFVL